MISLSFPFKGKVLDISIIEQIDHCNFFHFFYFSYYLFSIITNSFPDSWWMIKEMEFNSNALKKTLLRIRIQNMI